ncbi:S-locus glycoprotein [Trema orientale]|uniref:non-specific serine/threonine protein kinase n=1 Tax=Trema orientale TaxID=63057 RepID=A0A2P5AW26_TREOI|nr:S-locus glycoprotein [Trema orientale]
MISWSVNHMLFISLFHSVFLYTSFMCSLAKDTITYNSLLSDEKRDSLVSAGEVFELGFFTPNGSFDNRRYVGIWYYKSRTVVWVANRDKPLSASSGGVLAISDNGNLEVLDRTGKSYWSTNVPGSIRMSRAAKLMDTGNLVLSNEDPEGNSMTIQWQSFENPTDTFLPGMMLDENLVLTSWKSSDDPGSGNFTFQQDQERTNQVIILKRSVKYWNSGVSGRFISLNEMPPAILYLLSNFTSKTVRNNSVPYLTSSLYNHTRLVMSISGQIQYLRWDSQMVWSPIWAEPRDKCSVYNACGNFGSCNSKNNLVCKCLPGFKPISPDDWISGDYSGGCVRKTTTCRNNSMVDTFLDLKMMKVGNPDSQFNAKSETECKIECLNNCQCQAYLFEEAEMSQGSSACWIWSEELNNLQEEYATDRNLHVRVAVSDIELTARSCEACGTNLIPYPLSIGPNCGDPLYYSFHCNNSDGQVGFETPSGTFRVTSINPDTRTFFIRIKDDDNCKNSDNGKFLKLNQSWPQHKI